MTNNPFLSVWTQPKQTIRDVLENKGSGFTIAMAGLAGIGGGLINLEGSGFGESLPLFMVFLVAALIGVIISIIGVYISAGLYTMVGKWFGGTGNFRRMMIAIGPSYIPQIVTAAAYLLVAIMYAEQFVQATDPTALGMEGITALPIGAYLITLFISAVFGIWGVVIVCKAIGIVHGFSSWKGLGVILTVAALVFALVLVIGIIIVFTVFI
ncbi:YIP1 family protein [Jeotgalibacillus proteolyticus]|uniref:Yip1 domain-containing protein n=1 Tax=Jeotgalibacillus proteolyticus TaxID=2082395 RepID=A0A2S5GCD9_9BACL|nr:YIP1 family protein [Jeotgalibacillus proteolyticus]PPA70659.1 hypothetical protein C4B60_07620 [Jeotgalibacillus proteolyticus]